MRKIAILGISYASVSLLAFMFPSLLHTKDKHSLQIFNEAIQGKKIIRIAHRGGPCHRTENTVQAFKFSAPLSDMLELDVCETKDGVLVVHHDEDLWRTCGVHSKISEYRYEDLPPFKKQINIDFLQGIVKSNGERIPKLQEVLKQFKQIPLNIELKTPTDTAIESFASILKSHNRFDNTIIGIRNEEKQEMLMDSSPTSLFFAHDKEVKRILFLYFTGLLPFCDVDCDSLQLPFYSREFYLWKICSVKPGGHGKELEPSYISKIPILFKYEAYFILLKTLNFLIRPMLWHLRQRGIMTYYWVCNKEKDVKRAIDYGACGVMSDDPRMLSKVVEKCMQAESIFEGLL